MSSILPIPTQPVPEATPKASSNQQDTHNFLSLLSLGSVESGQTDTLGPQAQPRQPSPPEPAGSRQELPQKEATSASTSEPRPEKPAITQRADIPARPQPTEKRTQEAATSDKPRPVENNEPTQKQSDPQQQTPAQPALARSDNSAQNAEEPLSEKPQKIREALSDSLDDISALLAMLIQALALQKQATVETGGESLIPAAQATEAQPQLISGALIEQTASLPITAEKPASEASTQFNLPQTQAQQQEAKADSLDLLAQIQALLQQLKQTVQEANTLSADQQAAAAQATPAEAFQATTAKPQANPLEQKLQQLLQQLGARPQDQVTVTVQTTTAQPQETLPEETSPESTNTLKELFSALKEKVSELRNELGQLRQQNEQGISQMQEFLRQQFDNARQQFRELPAQPESLATQQAPSTQPAAPAEIPAEAAIVITTSETETKPVLVNASPAAAASTGNILPQAISAPSEASLNQQNGGQQQSGSQQPATPSIGTTTSRASQNASQTPEAHFARSLQRATPALVTEQVSFQVKAALRQGTSEIRIQLDPEDLGKLDIKLTIEPGGKTGVTVLVENRQTLDLLQKDAQSLARALSDAGLSTDSGSLNFNLRGGNQEQPQGESGHASLTYRKAIPDEEHAEPVITTLGLNAPLNTASGLDITI